jgi:hypothetical protein
VGNEVSILKGIDSGVRGRSFIGWSSGAGETAMVLTGAQCYSSNSGCLFLYLLLLGS